jgi:hypothetical protein
MLEIIITIYLFIFILFYLINNYLVNNYLFNNHLKKYEKFINNFNSITFNFSNSVGFYSNLFFVMNNYIYCKKNNLYFNINDTNWLFKKEKGWEDYFLSININNDKPNNNLNVTKHGNVLENYPIYEYKNILNEFYRYNDNTKNEINNIKKKYNL